MSNRPQSTYRNSKLARSKVKKNSFVALCSNLFMQQRSEIGLVEDRANSTTIIRIIVGLLLVHLIIIGGIILHGKINNEGGGSGVESAIVIEKPEEPQSITEIITEPKPVEGPKTNRPTHITQPTEKPAQPVVAEPTTTPKPVVDNTPKPADKPAQPVINPTTPPKNAIAHVIKSGESTTSIAAKYGVTINELKEVNPALKENPNNIIIGKTLWIPNKNAVTTTQKTEATDDSEFVEYTVVSGDTFSRIAKKAGEKDYKKVMELNGITNERSLKIGQKLKLRATPKAVELVKKQKK